MNKEDWLSNYYDSNIEFITQGLDEKDRDELKAYVPKYINILDDFKYIDGEADICGIIANNYVNKIIEEVRNISDTKKEMRNLKIEKII